MKSSACLLTNSRTTEVSTVSERIIAEYKKGNWSSDPYLPGIFTKLQPASTSLIEAINRIKAESDLEEKDELRDNYTKAINSIVTGFLHHPDAAVKAAAQKVDAVFEHYGVQITMESYATQSSLTNSLLQDFAGEEILAAIAVLPGLSPMIESLKTAQAAFEAAELIFTEEKAKDGNKENATIIKKEVTAIINEKLVAHLTAMVNIDEAKYGAFAATVAQIIDDMNVTVKKRKKTGEQDNTAATNNATQKSN